MVWPQSDLIVFHLHWFYMQAPVLTCTVYDGTLWSCLIFLVLISLCTEILGTQNESVVLLVKKARPSPVLLIFLSLTSKKKLQHPPAKI